MNEVMVYVVAIVAVTALICLCLVLDIRVKRAESLEDQIAQDEAITNTYKWLRQIFESEAMLKQITEYDIRNGTQYEQALHESFDVIDDFMENRGNNLMGYLLLAVTTVPKVVDILRTVGLTMPGRR